MKKVQLSDNRGLVGILNQSQLDQISGVPGFSDLIDGFKFDKVLSGVCPYCGWTDDKYLATGYVGCGLCYSSLPSLAVLSND